MVATAEANEMKKRLDAAVKRIASMPPPSKKVAAAMDPAVAIAPPSAPTVAQSCPFVVTEVDDLLLVDKRSSPLGGGHDLQLDAIDAILTDLGWTLDDVARGCVSLEDLVVIPELSSEQIDRLLKISMFGSIS